MAEKHLVLIHSQNAISGTSNWLNPRKIKTAHYHHLSKKKNIHFSLFFIFSDRTQKSKGLPKIGKVIYFIFIYFFYLFLFYFYFLNFYFVKIKRIVGGCSVGVVLGGGFAKGVKYKNMKYNLIFSIIIFTSLLKHLQSWLIVKKKN